MGWSFNFGIRSKAEMVAHLTRATRFNERFELLKSTSIGNNHWYLSKCKENGNISIGLDLMAGGGDEGWGYKDMSEYEGPREVNCPLSYLNAASEPTGYAVAWREEVRKYHSMKAARPALTAGLVVTYGQCTYQLVRSAGPRRGWHVKRTSDGANFRMKCTKLALSETEQGNKSVLPAESYTVSQLAAIQNDLF